MDSMHWREYDRKDGALDLLTIGLLGQFSYNTRGIVVKHLSRSKLFLIVGLLFVLIGNYLPIRFPILNIQHSFEIGPGDFSSESVDIPLSIFYGESVSVTVEFDSFATPDDCWVWTVVNYQYPTKGVSETAIRLEGQREVSFTFGWEIVHLIPIFVTGFMVRLFYLGIDSVSVDVSILRLGNLVTLTGLGFLVILAAIILKPVITNRLGSRKNS
jgi:hypothetical protein